MARALLGFGLRARGLGGHFKATCLRHFQVGSYRYRSLIEGLYTLKEPYRSSIYPKLPTCSFL